ncbi:MAG: hypothetical protein KBS56_04995 [Clostridiales bacterium]|nr:hypothetical protein [Candidatus Crickella equi]
MSRIGARIILCVLCLAICVPLVMYFVGDNRVVGTGGQAQFSELTVPDEDPIINNLDAVKVVTSNLPGSDIGDVMECTQTYEEGGWVYEGKIRGSQAEYAFRVDGDYGTLLKWEVVEKIKH